MMKTTLLLLTLLIVQFSFSQKKVKIKFKGNSYRYTMMGLPESALPYAYKKYDLKISDNGVDYIYNSVSTTKPTPEIVFSIPGKSLNPKNPDIFIKVEGLTATENGNDITSYSNQVGEKTYTYYNFNQKIIKKYLLTVIDAKSKETVYKDTLVVETKYEYPKDFTKSNGLVSKKNLQNMFEEYKNKMYESGKSKEFNNQLNRAIVINSKEGFKDQINTLLGFKKSPGLLTFVLPKTKDDRFEDLYGILELFKQGNDLMKENRSKGIVNNWHAQNTYDKFNEAYERLMKYDLAKCTELTGSDELGKEMFVNLKIPKLTAMIFTSRYEEALPIFEEYKPQKTEKVDEPKSDIAKGFKGAFSGLKMNPFTAPKSINASLFALWGIYVYEVKNYEKFSKAYDYYK